MRRGQHRNWLVTIAEIHLPFVLWGALIVAVAVGLLSRQFEPVYRATSILSLDNNLSKVLKNVAAPYPEVTHADFIRSEYFAIHSQTLMRMPEIAERFVERHDIRDADGKRLLPERLVEPGLVSLLFGNDGQGIRVSWVSDTQQFGITGYARDPQRAAEFANSYVQLLLDENVAQFRDTLLALEARFTSEVAELTGAIGELDEQSRRLRVEHHTIDPTGEVERVSERLLNVQDQLNAVLLSEKTYESQLAALERKVGEYEQFRKYQQVVQVNPQLAKLKGDIEDLAVELASASVDYTPEHPAYQSLEQKLETAMKLYESEAEKTFFQETSSVPGILDTVLGSMLTAEVDHVAGQAKVRHYRSLVEGYQSRTAEMIDLATRLDQLQQKQSPLATALTVSYTNLAAVKSAAKATLPFYRVVSTARVDPADSAYYRDFPKSSTAVKAFLAAFFALAFLVVARELHAETLYHGWQLAGRDERLVWADVPTLTPGALRAAGWEQVVAGHARDVFAAARGERLIRLASALPGSGKATLAAALGVYLRNLGESVVLIDADTSRKSLSGMKGRAGLPGLAEILGGSLSAAEAVQRDDAEGLAVLPAGQVAVSRIAAGAVGRMLADLEASFTRVVVVEAATCDNQTALADHLPPHRTIVVARSGRQAVGEVWDAARSRGGAPGAPDPVIVNRVPFEADILSFRGLFQLARHLVTRPFQRRR